MNLLKSLFTIKIQYNTGVSIKPNIINNIIGYELGVTEKTLCIYFKTDAADFLSLMMLDYRETLDISLTLFTEDEVEFYELKFKVNNGRFRMAGAVNSKDMSSPLECSVLWDIINMTGPWPAKWLSDKS